MGIQLFPRFPGELVPVPPRVIKNSMAEEGETRGDGWTALVSLALVFCLVSVLSALIFQGEHEFVGARPTPGTARSVEASVQPMGGEKTASAAPEAGWK
jgi:hypothetical protein